MGIEAVDDESKNIPGENLMLQVNMDDDDASAGFDINETDLEGEDDDLASLPLEALPADAEDLTARVEIVSGAAYVGLWNNARKEVEIESGTEWAMDEVPEQIYIEGREQTPARDTVQLELSLLDPEDTTVCSDGIIAQVVNLDLIGEKSYWIGSLESEELEPRDDSEVEDEIDVETKIKTTEFKPIEFATPTIETEEFEDLTLPQMTVFKHHVEDYDELEEEDIENRRWSSTDWGGTRSDLLGEWQKIRNAVDELNKKLGDWLDLSYTLDWIDALIDKIKEKMPEGEGDKVYATLSYEPGEKEVRVEAELKRGHGNVLEMGKYCLVDVDMYLDSDNNNRYNMPDRSEEETQQRKNGNPKVIMLNVDDDAGDGKPDNHDQDLDDDDQDAAPMVLRLDPGPAEEMTVYVSVDNRQYIRIFGPEPDRRAIIGPELMEPVQLEAELFDEEETILLIEGVANGVATVTFEVEDEEGNLIGKESALIKATDTLEAEPFSFEHREQHKDTSMLCMECPKSGSGQLEGHDWDRAHPEHNMFCAHCNSNCARAAVQMVNHFYGGDISQDYLSYYWRGVWEEEEGHREVDVLGHGWAMPQDELPDGLGWAANFSGSQAVDYRIGPKDEDYIYKQWKDSEVQQFVADAVVSSRPVVMAYRENIGVGPNGYREHMWTICGIRRGGGGQLQLRRADPSRNDIDWDTPRDSLSVQFLGAIKDGLAQDAMGNARKDDPRIHKDTNGDGVCDFDREERFEGMGDKDDIWDHYN